MEGSPTPLEWGVDDLIWGSNHVQKHGGVRECGRLYELNEVWCGRSVENTMHI